jgi:hypothetical protein
MMTVRDRHGRLISVDMTEADEADMVTAPVIGEAVRVLADRAEDGRLLATSVQHAKDAEASWTEDR